ncbi:MAG: hypothetical protein ACR2GN_05735, partial [Bacteroidia bacterium]
YDQLGKLNQLNEKNVETIESSSKQESKQNVDDQSQPVVHEIKPEINKKAEENDSPMETVRFNHSDPETGKSPDHVASVLSHTESISQKSKTNPKTASLFDQNAESDDDDSEMPSINERMNKNKTNENSLADRLKQNRVKDLKQAIGINEKFLFINELFEGSLNDYNNAISQLNSLSSKDEAEKYMDSELKIKFKWNDSSKAHTIFVQLIERRFS